LGLSRFAGASPTLESFHWKIRQQVHELRGRLKTGDFIATARRRVLSGASVLRSPREPVSVLFDLAVPVPAAREWLAAAERELAGYPQAGSGSSILIVLSSRWPYSGRVWDGGATGRLWLAEGAGSMCVVSVFFSEAQASSGVWGARGNASGNLLDRCALYARFGDPGQHVQRWLGLGDDWNWDYRWGGRGLSRDVRRARRLSPRDTVQFARSGWWGGVPYQSIWCLRGGDAACESIAGVRPGARRRDYWYSYDYGRPDANLIAAHLIANRPAEAFARFWRSALPVDSALAQAYGMSAGALVREAMLRRWVPPAPARVGPLRLLTASAWVLVALGLAWLGAWRKEIPT